MSVFPQALLRAFEAIPNVPAFEYGPRVVTRGDVLKLISVYVGALRATDASLGPGCGIAIYTGVTPEAFAVQIAAHVLGLRVIGLKPGMAADLSNIIADARLLVVDKATSPDIDSSLPVALKIVQLEDLQGSPVAITSQGRLQDVALVLYTSGTTGGPKGVECTYQALTGSWAWQRSVWDQRTEEMAAKYQRFMLFGTLASTVMFEHLGLCLTGGGTAVIPNQPAALLQFPCVLADLRISAVLFTVPRLYHVLEVLRAEVNINLSYIQSIVISGSPLPPQKLRAAIKLFGDSVHNGYGMSETGLVCLLSAADVAAHPKAVEAVGRAWTGVELQVRDGDGSPVPVGTVGHVWVKSLGSFSGYTNEDSSIVLDAGGWVWTRDLGALDEDGLLYLTGRARDIVIINANVYYAGVIENALASHPDVDAAFVVSVPSSKTGEAAAAFVTAVNGQIPDLDALRVLVKERIGPAAVPVSITVIDSVPIAPSGKPDKQALLNMPLDKNRS
ncbi:acetyl-CoA synthetase-like protein [Hypoxylon rubiginosum]|uniref:Acetyl-CoA synthetase-like protein n=1 Tax=Hypoxylon rubiginosum TaxID=110542 RepID=A0ACC0CQH8_9PEZI|nr:acetyl-CoA synthetase-like protein [Hypoxylon rubiginosum]